MPEGYAVKVRPEKVEAVEEIKADLGGDTAVAVVTEYRGLTVGALKELRTKLLEVDASYRVVKNTLARRAAVDLGYEGLVELLVGPTAVAYAKGDPVAAAKVLSTFAKDHPELIIKGGILDGRVITDAETKDLATVDPLDVSRAKIMGLLTAALQNVMMISEAPARRILYVLEELGKREGAQEAAPAAEAASDEAPAAEASAGQEASAEAEAEAAPAEAAAPAEDAPAAEAAPEHASEPATEEAPADESTQAKEEEGETS